VDKKVPRNRHKPYANRSLSKGELEEPLKTLVPEKKQKWVYVFRM
jgi:hypothetical protein